MKRLLLLTVLLLTNILQSVLADEQTLYSVTSENIPALGETLTLYLGDKMMAQRTGKYLPCYVAQTDISWSKWGFKNDISMGDYFCKEQLNGPNFGYKANTFWDSNSQIFPLLVKVRKKSTKICLQSCFKKIQNSEFSEYFKIINMVVIEDSSFQQTIEYSGKSGSVLSFIYSEYVEVKPRIIGGNSRVYPEKMARDAFTREFKVDLDESTVGGFKGAVFEIISVDNVQIKYKVIRNFQ